MSVLGFLLLLSNAIPPGEAPATVFRENSKIFSCSPAVVGPGDVLVLRKRGSSLRELSVVLPSGSAAHFLVVSDPPPEMRPLMSPDELGKAKVVRIPVSALTGLEWRAGAHQESIFTSPGMYEFFLSTALESEDGGYSCKVQFRGPSEGANNSFKPKPLRGSA